jgi:N-dimethylarginine dimethylaminohydrolase
MPAYREFLSAEGKSLEYDGNMGIMHLDTIAMAVLEGPVSGEKTIIYGCKTILQYCQAIPVQQGHPVSLLHHIEGDGYAIKGWGEIRDIPLYEQQQLEPNMTVVSVGTVAGIAPTQTETADMLELDEIYAPRIDMSEFAKCGGRGHCASGQLKKSAPWMSSMYAAANQAVEVPLARAV